jgi:RecA/RadA recombinase
MENELPSIHEIKEKIQKQYGDHVCEFNPPTRIFEKLSTGILSVNLLLLGGIIRGKINLIYGPPRSGKGNFLKKIIAQTQQDLSGITCYIDAENDYDSRWASLLGVDNSRVLLQTPYSAEDIIEIALQSLHTSDIDLLIIDSLAEMVPYHELNQPIEKSKVGGASHLISSLGRQLVVALSTLQRKYDKTPTVILVNQPRQSIGGYFSGETLPGGRLIMHASPLVLRVSGKTEYGKCGTIERPVAHETHIVVKDAKMPIGGKEAVYTMNLTVNEQGPVGFIDNRKILRQYLKQFNLLEKQGLKWVFQDQEFKSQQEALAYIENDAYVMTCKLLYEKFLE